jgi:predicted PurR-regulated permease PerM
MEKRIKIEISLRNAILIFAIPIFLLLAWQLRTVIFMFFVSFVLASAVRPLVQKLHEFGIPRLLSIIIIYVVVILVFVLIIYITSIAVVEQVARLTEDFSSTLSDTIKTIFESFPWLGNIFPDIQNIIDSGELMSKVESFVRNDLGNFIAGNTQITEVLGGAGEAVVSAVTQVITVVIGIVTVFMVSAYMIQREDKFYAGLLSLLPKKEQKWLNDVIDKVESKLGAWLIGQIVLMIIIGIATYIGLILPGIFLSDTVIDNYALALALLAGLLEAIPTLGPTLTWVIALIVIFGSGGSVLALIYITILFMVIQQFEGIFLVPNVMKKAIGIDPIVTILGMIAASIIFGLPGAIMILPFMAIVQIVIEEFTKKRV